MENCTDISSSLALSTTCIFQHDTDAADLKISAINKFTSADATAANSNYRSVLFNG